jgi:hypothetical protein
MMRDALLLEIFHGGLKHSSFCNRTEELRETNAFHA